MTSPSPWLTQRQSVAALPVALGAYPARASAWFNKFADLFQLLQQQADRVIEGLNLAEVIGDVLANFRHVRQKFWQLPFERVRLDAPQRLAGAAFPHAMHVGWTEPITKRLIGFAIREEVLEVAGHVAIQLGLGLFERLALLDHLRAVLGEVVELSAGLFVGESLAAKRSVVRLAGAPDFVRLPDVIAGVIEQQRETRNLRVPHGSLQNRRSAGAPEILSRQQRTAARSTRRRVDVRSAKEHPLAGDAINVRSLDDIVHRPRTFDLRKDAGVAAPVIREREQDVRPLWLGRVS